MKRESKGWLFRDAQSIIVQIHGAEEKRFDLGRDGETAARNHITKVLDRDDWTLGDMAFLGYRIQVPGELATLRQTGLEWSDAKAEGVCILLSKYRPGWSAQPEWFNGMFMMNIDVGEAGNIHFVCGNANKTLGANVYISLDALESGDPQEEAIDTELDADDTPIEMLAGALIGAVETFMVYVLPTYTIRREMIIDEPTV